MGYASTQAFDEEAIRQLIEGVKEGASAPRGRGRWRKSTRAMRNYPTVVSYDETLALVPATAKLDAVLAIEKAAFGERRHREAMRRYAAFHDVRRSLPAQQLWTESAT